MPLGPGTKQNAVRQMCPADIFWILRQESQYLTGAKCSSTTFGGAVQIPFSLTSTGSVGGYTSHIACEILHITYHASLYIYLYFFIPLYTGIYMWVYTYVCMYVYIHMRMCMGMSVGMGVGMGVEVASMTNWMLHSIFGQLMRLGPAPQGIFYRKR